MKTRKKVPTNGTKVRFEIGRNLGKPRIVTGYVVRSTDADTVRVCTRSGDYTVAINDLEVVPKF